MLTAEIIARKAAQLLCEVGSQGKIKQTHVDFKFPERALEWPLETFSAKYIEKALALLVGNHQENAKNSYVARYTSEATVLTKQGYSLRCTLYTPPLNDDCPEPMKRARIEVLPEKPKKTIDLRKKR